MRNLSFWETDAFFSPHDFIIAGGGLVGLWTAYELKIKYPKAKVSIFERGNLPYGASTRNAGFACFGSPTELIADMHSMGEDEMLGIVEMRFKGINKIRQIVGDDNIDFSPVGGFECYTTQLNDVEELSENVALLNQSLKRITGLENSFEWCNDELQKLGLSGFDAMVKNRLEGGLHSGKLVKALTALVQNMGVTILTGIEVKGWEQGSEGVLVQTPESYIVTRKLILATNAFTHLLNSTVPVTPGRGQIILTEPIHQLKLKGTFHFDEGYYYFRNVGNRVLLGGARNKAFDKETTTNLETTNIIQAELERFMGEHILHGVPYTISQRWSGIMAFTPDKKPYINEVEPNVHAIISCNGMGVALSPIMADVFVSLL